MAIDVIIEALADYAHSAWSGWMRYLFQQGTLNKDGSFTIPKDKVQRWSRQMSTRYKDLPDKEKESDRKEAREILEAYYHARYRWEAQ
jgi:hypothetical protein